MSTFDDQVRRRVECTGTAQIDISRAFKGLAIAEFGCTHNHIGEAVAVDITHGHALPESRIGNLWRNGHAARRDPARAAKTQQDHAGVGATGVVPVGTACDIGKPVAIDVTAGHGAAAEATALTTKDGVAIRDRHFHAALIEQDHASIDLGVVAHRHADHIVRESVAIAVEPGQSAPGMCVQLAADGAYVEGRRDAGSTTQIDRGRTFVGQGAVVQVCGNCNIRVAVAIDVANAGDARALMGIDLVDLQASVRRRVECTSTAMEHECRAFIAHAVVVQRRAHEHIAVAVAIDVTCASDAASEVRRRLIHLQVCIGTDIKDTSTTEIEKRSTLVDVRGHATTIVFRSANNKVGEAITVDVTNTRSAAAHARVRLGRGQGCINDVVERVATEIQKHHTRVRGAAVITNAADEQIGKAIAVDVTRASEAGAQVGGILVAFQLSVDHGVDGGAAEIQKGRALVIAAVVEQVGTDQKIGKAITIDVPCAGNGDAEARLRLCRAERPVGRRIEAATGSEIEVGRAGIGSAVVIAGHADQQIVEAITIHITHMGDAGAELGIGHAAHQGSIRKTVDQGLREIRSLRRQAEQAQQNR